jgi:uncharacterized membrane protein
MRVAMLIIHFIGIALGVGAGFASLFIGSANKNLSAQERPAFMLRLRSLGYMGLTGLILLIISGGYLATPYWIALESMPFFIAKLCLVVVLLTLAIIMDRHWRKAIKQGGGPNLAAIPKLGKLAFPIGILIIILAVLQFK